MDNSNLIHEQENEESAFISNSPLKKSDQLISRWSQNNQQN
jgi:hypothetical protein